MHAFTIILACKKYLGYTPISDIYLTGNKTKLFEITNAYVR